MTKTKIIPKGSRPRLIEPPAPIGYIEYIPEHFPATENEPLVIALHGKGDGGKDPGSLADLTIYQNKSGHLPKMLNDGVISPACIVIMPQTHNGYLELSALVNFVSYISNLYQTENIAIMGFSAGGASVWKALDTVIKKENGEDMYVANLFKAFIPICGAYEQKKHFAFPEGYSPNVWAFHGAKDITVFPHWSIKNCGWITGYFNDPVLTLPVKLSEISTITHDVTVAHPINLEWIETIPLAYGYHLMCTIYANEGHGIWGKVYKNEMMWEWLISCLTGEEQPPVEENPLDQATDLELLVLARSIHTPIDLLTTIDNELELRAEEIIKRLTLTRNYIKKE